MRPLLIALLLLVPAAAPQAATEAEIAEGRDRLARERAAQQARNDAREAAAQQEAQAKEDALRKVCGKDFRRVRVGMSFKRVRECAGDFELVGQSGATSVYEADGGFVRVVKGKVTWWAAK